MIRDLMKGLLGLVQREDAGTDELAPSLPAAQAELAAARDAQAAAEQAYKGSLLAGNEAETLKLDAARREAGVRIDRAVALVEALRERLAEAQEREAEVARVQLYEAAKAKAAEGREALALYPQVAADLLTILNIVAAGEAAVVEANANLPRGAERLDSVEGAVRNIPAVPDAIVSEDTTERWVEVGRTEPGSFDQNAVYQTGPRRGVIRASGIPVNECRQVELRRFLMREYVPGTVARVARKLVEEVVLPGFLAGEPAYAEPIQRPLQGGLQPGDVIAHLRQLRARRDAADATRDQPRPQQAPSIKLVPVSSEPVRALPAPPAQRELRGRYADEEV